MAQFDSTNLKTLGVYASGGDAPGMNAAIRAVVRTAIYRKFKIVGIMQGLHGLFRKTFCTDGFEIGGEHHSARRERFKSRPLPRVSQS
jgi:6-phosphofructokinase